jgi:glycosyltransferase involved in cell wall biosynthesis
VLAVPTGHTQLKISVITAVHNAETTLAEAIVSVASQTFPDIEHIVIEGNSSDRSLAVLARAAHARMTLYSEPDSGIYDALNKGIARATGDVIGFVHADDFLAYDRVLERVAAAFADPGVEAVYSDLDDVARTDTARIVQDWKSAPDETDTDILAARRGLADAFNAHDIERVMGYFAVDCSLDMPRGPDPHGKRYQGTEQVKKGLMGRFESMPDVLYSDLKHFVSGNCGMSKWLLTGTKANGQSVMVRGCDFYTFERGLVVRKDSYWKIVE